MLSGLSFFTATNVGELSLGLNQRPGHTMLQIACVATMVHLEQRRKNEFLSSVRTLMLVKKLQVASSLLPAAAAVSADCLSL